MINKLLLINPPGITADRPSYTYLYPPLGLLSIYGYLKSKITNEHNYDLKFIDMVDKTHLDIMKAIETYMPDMVGIGTMTPSYTVNLQLCSKIKNNFPGIKILIASMSRAKSFFIKIRMQ